MSDDDWIVVTVARSGHVKHVRRSAITSFGSEVTQDQRHSFAYITIEGRAVTVKESEAELKRLLGVE